MRDRPYHMGTRLPLMGPRPSLTGVRPPLRGTRCPLKGANPSLKGISPPSQELVLSSLGPGLISQMQKSGFLDQCSTEWVTLGVSM